MASQSKGIDRTKELIRIAFRTGINPVHEQAQWMMVRIITNIFILIMVDTLLAGVNPYIITMINLIIVWVLDPMDSIPMQLVYGRAWCKTRDYVNMDKVGDMAIYAVVLILHIMMVKTIGTFEIIFAGLYFFRLIGVILNIHTGNDVFLFLFPNYFGMNIILYLFLKYIVKVSSNTLFVTMAVSIPGYSLYEAVHHLWIQKTIN